MIVIAPDKFKGSLTARQAAGAIAAGFADAGCREEIVVVEMADGGEGTPASIGRHPVVAVSDHVGLANASLCALPIVDRSSFCLGEYLRRAYGPDSGFARRLTDGGEAMIGIGGTMTADGGAGMLQAMGTRFYGPDGSEITIPVTPRLLAGLTRTDLSGLDAAYWRRALTAISDVRATLTGPGLSALDFLTQKGATDDDELIIGRALERLRVAFGPERRSAIDGAGGGIGYAVAGVIGAEWRMGSEVVLAEADIDWPRVTLVATGEGRIDSQTAGGKVVDTLRRTAAAHSVRALAFGGYVAPELRSADTISTIDSPADYSPALAAERLRRAAAKAYAALFRS